MSNSDYSRLLTKMAELKELTAQYKELTGKYRPATTDQPKGTYDQIDNKNAMSNTTTPLVTRPGDDHAKVWKYVGKINPGTNPSLLNNSLQCWNLAANDTRLFKKVVYTGESNIGQQEWNNRCYGLIYDAPGNAVYDTSSNGYTTMTGNITVEGSKKNIYTKLGIRDEDDITNIAGAAKVQDIQQRVNSLVREIVGLSEAGIDNELNKLVTSASDTDSMISQLHNYMNSKSTEIERSNELIQKRKNMNSVYGEINEQRTLLARKYRFIFYVIIAVCIILGYASYTSKISIIEQAELVKNLSVGWWTSWWVITIVVILLILSSFGWNIKDNILMILRYISDPTFWTGQLWWIGVTFLLLIIIFLHASLKSFFTGFDTTMKEMQDRMDKE